MKQIVEQALALWGMRDAKWSLVAARENHVYRIDLGQTAYALRLHRVGLRSDAELRSELQWMAALGEKGVGVPTPVLSTEGLYLHLLQGIQIDMLGWLPGRPLGATGSGIDHEDRTGVFHTIGREMARLHKISDDWSPPPGFSRWSWDRPGLLGKTPLWDRFWENPTLTAEDQALFLQFRKVADHKLRHLESKLDYGLIHADLVRENVMVDSDRVWLIDFDDAGFGFRLFDIVTTLLKNLEEPDCDLLREALLTGYRTERQICTEHLDLFMALRAATYVGWISSRLQEDGSDLRNTRFIETARNLLTRYLDTTRINGRNQ
ncbi:Ser/Thr protein kinase RdoA involved in Cpx stress response, MazF antagonist [Ruegeria halocynthiae]|uniref:Ser/Thr protein kinase RdoA involved in Cpx stress response, MazF antagonist n=1 Tax=Ruegeria halocynthiae TaxID=985054 RepID=A0A1H2XZI0_9RHOB|nr:phosphotransferase [Ruegeria halocynthiae]SDW98343.1 Ser/Thr protein kinase RdoA involved in Cpx stress response, MazF antagonist [Ruegeria halocynthiae]